MSEIDPSTSRNSPCPCGSGKKYKRCHGATDAKAVDGSGKPDGMVRVLAIASVIVSVGVGVAFQPETGLGVFGAAVIGVGAFAIFRNPPPPKSGPDDPAAINFGG